MCDILWADPMELYSFSENKALFSRNTLRGCSYTYSFRAVCEFLDRNKLLSVIRAHEAQDAGYCMHTKNDKTGFPSLITLFSAPNYLNSYHNKGAVLRYENNIINIRQFNENPQPYYLPGFMNVFNWSLPFIGDKIADFVKTILALVDDKPLDQAELNQDARRDQVRNRIKTAGLMLSLLKNTRDKIHENSGVPRASITVEIATMSKDEIVHEQRPEGADVILERVKKEQNHPSNNGAKIRRQKTRDKIVMTRENFVKSSTTTKWGSEQGSQLPVIVEKAASQEKIQTKTKKESRKDTGKEKKMTKEKNAKSPNKEKPKRNSKEKHSKETNEIKESDSTRKNSKENSKETLKDPSLTENSSPTKRNSKESPRDKETLKDLNESPNNSKRNSKEKKSKIEKNETTS